MSATFGWPAEGQGVPAGCTVNGAECAGPPADHTAPARPGPLAFSTTAGLALAWGPAAGDHGPVRYEVHESGRLLTTVTGTRYAYSTGPALPPRIHVFAVRAVDAAGNVSPFRFRTLGQVWRGDRPASRSWSRRRRPAPTRSWCGR